MHVPHTSSLWRGVGEVSSACEVGWRGRVQPRLLWRLAKGRMGAHWGVWSDCVRGVVLRVAAWTPDITWSAYQEFSAWPVCVASFHVWNVALWCFLFRFVCVQPVRYSAVARPQMPYCSRSIWGACLLQYLTNCVVPGVCYILVCLARFGVPCAVLIRLLLMTYSSLLCLHLVLGIAWESTKNGVCTPHQITLTRRKNAWYVYFLCHIVLQFVPVRCKLPALVLLSAVLCFCMTVLHMLLFPHQALRAVCWPWC